MAGTVRRMAQENAAQQIEESRERALIARDKKSALQKMGERLDVGAGQLKQTLLDTVFKGARNDSEFIALVVAAEAYQLNPLLKEIYAFPAKGGGIVPMVSIDGWYKIANSHPDYDGVDFTYIENAEGKIEAIEAIIFHKGRSHPIRVTEYLEECIQSTDPWRKLPRRMLRHRAFIQGVRMAFGFSGIVAEGDSDVIDGDYREVSSDGPILPPREDDFSNRGPLPQDSDEIIDEETGEVTKRNERGMTEVDEETARALDAGGSDEDPGYEPDEDDTQAEAAAATVAAIDGPLPEAEPADEEDDMQARIDRMEQEIRGGISAAKNVGYLKVVDDKFQANKSVFSGKVRKELVELLATRRNELS